MTLVMEVEQASRDAELARLRRVLAVRAMLVEGQSQREVANRLGVTQPAISYQVAGERTTGVRPSDLIAAGGSVLRQVAQQRGFTDLAVFGSAARGDDRPDSDVDFLVTPPSDMTFVRELVELEGAFAAILGRPVDIVTWGALDDRIDRDIRRDAVRL